MKNILNKLREQLAKVERELDKCRTSTMQDGWQTQRFAKKSRKWDVLAQRKMQLIQMIEDEGNAERDRYYYLKEGDIIKEGDEVEMSANYNDPAKWVKATNCIGEKAPNPHYMAHRVYRRLKTIEP